MTITYPLAMPATPVFKALRFRARSRVAVSPDPFVGTSQAYAWPGQWWEGDAELPPMTRAEAEEWISFRLMLNGREGVFHIGDPLGATPRGLALGTPLVDGANAIRSRTLATKGWTAGQTGILLAGDWVQVGTGLTRRLYKNLQDVNSDGSGKAVLDIYPFLREALSDDAAITVLDTKGSFRMADNVTEWYIAEAEEYGLAFSFMEAF